MGRQPKAGMGVDEPVHIRRGLKPCCAPNDVLCTEQNEYSRKPNCTAD
jgi:hypothetical protein